MSVIIPAGYAQVVLVYSSAAFDSGSGATLLGFGAALGDDPTSLDDFAQIVIDGWDLNMKASTDSSVTLATVVVNGPTTGATRAAGITGTGAWNCPPPNTALLASYSTGRRGPRGRGRSYFPGMLSEAEIDEGGIVASGWLSDAAAAIGSFIEYCKVTPDPEVNHVILQGDNGASTPISPPPSVTSRVVQNKVATQRRRLRR